MSLRARLRDERGISLTELLMAMTLMVIVLGASLSLFSGFETANRAATVRNDSQDRVRTALDRLARDLRNLAGASATQGAIDKASAYDLMFLTVDPVGPNTGQNASNLRRVRYCLDASAPNNEVMWMQYQTWTAATVPSPPSTTSCPDPAWGNQMRFADTITNEYAGQNRAAFSFDASTAANVRTVHADLYANVNVLSGPPTETHLSTGVFLRNQVIAPTGVFNAQAQSGYRIILNGSDSSDPQGQALTYVWYDGATKIGTGITYTFLAGGPASAHTITLKVFDASGLEGDAVPQSVTTIQ